MQKEKNLVWHLDVYKRQYIYSLANALNHFYHETKIMVEEDAAVQAGYIRLLELTRDVLETCIDVLGFDAPEKM